MIGVQLLRQTKAAAREKKRELAACNTLGICTAERLLTTVEVETHALAASGPTQTSLMFGLVEPEGLQTLEAMGFPRDAAKAALTAHNGDVAAAAAQLSQPSVEDKCRSIASRLAKADAAAAAEVAALLATNVAEPARPAPHYYFVGRLGAVANCT